MTASVSILAGLVSAAIAAATQSPKPVPPPADVKAPPATAAKTKSGLASRVLTPGNGKTHPASDDLVTVHYAGWTTDGKMFDSSLDGEPVTFPLDRVISGWTEGVQLMVAGEKRRLWIPETLAYKGRADRPKGMLVFDVELVETRQDPKIPPADVKAPPADAKKTSTGLAFKVLRVGTGSRNPQAWSKVTVDYSGWTTDGKLFDSTVVRGKPMTLELNGVIQGWTEGVALMVEGERRRFWIPENLAYKGEAGQPRGMLVFDIELVKIE